MYQVQEQAVRTHPDGKLLKQHRYKSAAGLLHVVRCHVYSRYSVYTTADLLQGCFNMLI